MKKRIFSIGSIIILSILLIACNDSEEVENPPQNDTSDANQQQTEQNNTDTTNEAETDSNSDTAFSAEYGFTNFDLEVDYAELDDALDIDYENEKNDEMEASYHHKAEGFDLKGDDAMEDLDNIFSSFSFDENTADEDVINEVSEAFNIPEDAKKIELDIEFSNGTEKEYQK